VKTLRILMLVTLISGLLLAACEPETVVEQVEVTKVVEVEKAVEVTVEVEKVVEVEKEVEVTKIVEVEKEVEVPAAGPETIIEFWTTDNEEERVTVYEQIAESFMAEHPEIEVRIVPIEEAGVTQRVATALAANRPPDIIRMGI
jgi:ABC-type glycerol-3-phosphate transport system substrate-binding protein